MSQHASRAMLLVVHTGRPEAVHTGRIVAGRLHAAGVTVRTLKSEADDLRLPDATVLPASQRAAEEFYPGYAEVMTQLGRERGWGPSSYHQFEQLRAPHGSLLVGSPEEVAEKILYEHELFGHSRFLAQMDIGRQPHERVMRAIELFGTRVAPVVRRELGASATVAVAPSAGPVD